MSKRMVIDATHSEETRVAIIDQTNTITDYDFNSSLKKTVKGNIYLAKIARVEPSLQAAFVEYGGVRHGFLAFNEIHPDYFRIPVSDREQLQKEILTITETANGFDDDILTDVVSVDEDDNAADKGVPLEDGGKRRFASLHRRYKIQEVLQKGQIVLIQVTKEERGGKGAALTTFLSLPGRYCVLMPNSPKSGGISRKISNQNDRIRLKKSLSALNLPQGMGLIVRTAGKDRTRTEIKKDAEYLMRLWNDIRETTLASVAPSIIYHEDDIIKRAIRDMYSKDVDEILVEGDEGYKNAKTFMKTLMPSHSKKIKQYKDARLSLFHHYALEGQIESMHHAQVYLPSGGSIVIHPTEALVSVDVNSGKSTRERHIEETALKTNLEAATEVARQIRLRDLAGLIVIDFIDMDEPRNIGAVERRMKESFKYDRARIQMGRISSFGLFELSRQRLSPSILEVSAHPCSHCSGTGYIRSTESLTVHILRMIEQECLKSSPEILSIKVSTAVAFYIFNHKRNAINLIESRQTVKIIIDADDHLGPENFIISTTGHAEESLPVAEPKIIKMADPLNPQAAVISVISDASVETDSVTDEGDKKSRRPRRRPKKKGRDTEGSTDMIQEQPLPQEDAPVDVSVAKPMQVEKKPLLEEGAEKTLSASARRRRRKKLASREAKALAQSENTDVPVQAKNVLTTVPTFEAVITALANEMQNETGDKTLSPQPLISENTLTPSIHDEQSISHGTVPSVQKHVDAEPANLSVENSAQDIKHIKIEVKPAPYKNHRTSHAAQVGDKATKSTAAIDIMPKHEPVVKADDTFKLSTMDVLTLAPSLHPTKPGDIQPTTLAKKTDKTWWRRLLNTPSTGTKP